ncbi:hypothetical protein [Microtetraspora malaysiensis]|uniref:hypothetical protein n=1 Tax=Microtetraspora malaysiensis TaxID=161358 RepID=UPI003D8B88BB
MANDKTPVRAYVRKRNGKEVPVRAHERRLPTKTAAAGGGGVAAAILVLLALIAMGQNGSANAPSEGPAPTVTAGVP